MEALKCRIRTFQQCCTWFSFRFFIAPSRFPFNSALCFSFASINYLFIYWFCSFVQYFLLILIHFDFISYFAAVLFKPIQFLFLTQNNTPFYAMQAFYFIMHSFPFFFCFFDMPIDSLLFHSVLFTWTFLFFFSIFIIYQTSTNRFCFAYFTDFLVCVGRTCRSLSSRSG